MRSILLFELMKYNYLHFFFILLFYFSLIIKSSAQKNVTAFYTNKNIVIDGVEDDKAWEIVEYKSSLWQWRPSDSIKANTQTKFKVLMDEDMKDDKKGK